MRGKADEGYRGECRDCPRVRPRGEGDRSPGPTISKQLNWEATMKTAPALLL